MTQGLVPWSFFILTQREFAMPSTRLVMVQCLDSEREIQEILNGEPLPASTMNRLIERFKGAMVPIPGQPSDGFLFGNTLSKGHSWVAENGRDKGMRSGDMYRAVILKGGTARFNAKVRKVNRRDVNAVWEVPIDDFDD